MPEFFVLILILYSSRTAHEVSAMTAVAPSFSTRAACDKAGVEFVNTMGASQSRYICLPK